MPAGFGRYRLSLNLARLMTISGIQCSNGLKSDILNCTLAAAPHESKRLGLAHGAYPVAIGDRTLSELKIFQHI